MSFTLHDFQREGVEWAVNRENDATLPGGMLLDEMGMGKTVQMIQVMLTNKVGKTLIVLPKQLVEQWKSQIIRFSDGQLHPVIFPNEDPLLLCLSRNIPCVVVLTSYGMVNEFYNPSKVSLFQFTWDRLILDEFHCLHNVKTKLHKTIVRIQANCKWGLSGTPIQHQSKELKGLMKIIGNNEYKKTDNVSQYIKRRAVHTTTEMMSKLPELELEVVKIPFSSVEEKKLYTQINNETHSVISDSKTVQMGLLLTLIIRLQQVLFHPQIIVGVHNEFYPNKQLPNWEGTTSKFTKLMDMLVNDRQKTIVFCKYRAEIDMTVAELTKHRISVEKLDGTLSARDRENLLQRIATSTDLPDVLCIQIRCGGVGLNLQNYTRLIITTSDWNPAYQQQAIARSFRLGQLQNVRAFVLCLYDNKKQVRTFDEIILKRIERKTKSIVKTIPFIPISFQQSEIVNKVEKQIENIDSEITMNKDLLFGPCSLCNDPMSVCKFGCNHQFCKTCYHNILLIKNSVCSRYCSVCNEMVSNITMNCKFVINKKSKKVEPVMPCPL